MNRIMMTKFGFERWASEDFSDDGNRFTCYRAGTRVRVSKLVSDGCVYIDGGIDDFKLPYDIYGKLPHYRAIGALNGIAQAALTEEMLTQLYFDCIEYEKEYDAALAALVYPSEEDIRRQCERIQYKVKLELSDIEHALSGKIMSLAKKLADWEWKAIKDNICHLHARFNNFDPEVYPKNLLGKSTSIAFCAENNNNCNDSWYYTQIMELINK